MNQVLFEAKGINTTRAIILLSASAIFFVLFICVSIVLCCKQKIKRLTGIYIFPVLIFFLIFSLYCLIQVPVQKKEIYDKYMNGDFLVEEGTVSIIYRPNNVEEYYFIINNTIFSLDNRQAYNFSCKDDMLCVSDGQYIKVSYVKYRDKNLIMKIENLPH